MLYALLQLSLDRTISRKELEDLFEASVLIPNVFVRYAVRFV
jgi:hypothetical protein